MASHEQQILRVRDLAQILGCSERAIRIRQARGQEGVTLPRSIKVGGRRVWMKKVVDDWLVKLSEEVGGDD